MKGGREAIRSISSISNISNKLSLPYVKNLESTNTKLSNENNTNKLNAKENSLEFKKKELIRMYGKYLDKDLLDKVFYNETTIHTLYNSLKTNNKEIIIKVSKNETITFK